MTGNDGTCPHCGQRPRRGRDSQLCAPCYLKAKRPKRQCQTCQKTKPTDHYTADKGRICKACQRNTTHLSRVTRKFGLAPGEYQTKLIAQEGRCAICRNQPRKYRLAVDHNHQTGKARGLLCKRCNHDLLGAAHDSIDILVRAVKYLEEYV